VGEPMVEYNPGFKSPFVVHLGGIEEMLTVIQFKAFFADCEDALQAYEGEKIANREYLKMKYERARVKRRK